MLSRKLFCVKDPTHVDFGWAAESRFLHIRKYDACGNTTTQWTFPVADTAPGELTCAVCGGKVYVAGARPGAVGDVMSCDFLGRCQSTPADANLACLDTLAKNLAAAPESERVRVLPTVAVLLDAIRNDPAAVAIVERYRLNDLYPDA